MYIIKSLLALFKYPKPHYFIANKTIFFDWFHCSTVMFENKIPFYEMKANKKDTWENGKKKAFCVLSTYVCDMTFRN